MSTAESRPKLLRGQTMPILYTTASRQAALDRDDGQTPKSDPTLLSALSRMSLKYNVSNANNANPLLLNSNNSPQSISQPATFKNDRERPQSLQEPPVITPFTRSPYPPTKSSSNMTSPATINAPMYSYSSPPYPSSSSSLSAQSQQYTPPYVLKCTGGSQQPSLEFSLDKSSGHHVLLARLGLGFSSECLTLAARRGNVLWIVADRWDRELDSKYEWYIQFDRDADLTRVHANFNHGLLKITVKRKVS